MRQHATENRNQFEVLQIRISKELKERLRNRANELDVTMGRIIKSLIEEYLELSDFVKENK